MAPKKTKRKRAPSGNQNLFEASQMRPLVITTVIYTIVALLALPLAPTFVGIMATPLWLILYFVISKWNRGGAKQETQSWRELLKTPKLNYLNIFTVILTIFAVQFAFGRLFAFVDERMRPSFYYSGSDDIAQDLSEFLNDPRSLVVMGFALVISYLAGGFIAGKLPNRKCPAPYRHAITATAIWNLLSFTLTTIFFAWGGAEDLPATEDFGYIILATSPSYLLSAFGTWIALKKRVRGASEESSIPLPDKQANALAGLNSRVTADLSKTKRGQRPFPKERASIEEESTVTPELPPRKTLATALDCLRSRRLALSISIVVICLLVLGFWAFDRKYPKPVFCENPPTTATLNFWPVTYVQSVGCHEYPPVDARLVGTDHYSLSQEEWERGLVAKKGDEIQVSIRINNGAMPNAEQLNPGQGIARNVRLKTAIAQDFSQIHYVEVEFAGDNTNRVVSRFKIATGELARIEVLPNSGELIDPISGNPISKDFDVGNNTLVIGDLPPKNTLGAGVVIRFRVRVVG